LVSEAANKLGAMLGAAADNLNLISGIAKVGREQASAIEEVSVSVRQMDEMTQHNAALVEETNAAIEQTEAQANELDRIAEFFALAGPAVAEHRGAVSSKIAADREVRQLREKKAAAGGSPRSVGNTALKDWEEF
jgi:methyl-accepting chemotaxis protein